MKFKYIYLLVFAVMLSFTACDDVLDEPQPDDAISQEIALSDEGAVLAIRAGMYGRLHNFAFQTQYMLAPDALADNLISRGGTSRFQSIFANALRAGAADGAYDNVYDLINDANLLLNAVEPSVIGNETLWNQIQAESYFFRAFGMHYLVKSHAYEPGVTPPSGPGAGWDAGIIIRTTPTLDISDADFRARSTVSEVYAQILSDLDDARSFVNSTNNARITLAAIEALAARVNLYARNYDAALTAATNARNASSASLATDASSVANLFDETAGDGMRESMWTFVVDPTTESVGSNGLAGYTTAQWIAMIPSGELASLYDAADYRNGWFGPCFDEANNQPIGNCIAGEIQKWNADKSLGQLTDDIQYFRVAEMVLIQAEAALLRSGGSIGNSLTYLNELRQARGLAPYVAADFASNSALMDEIVVERRKELVAEGHRYHDLKRLGRDLQKDINASGIDFIPFNDFRILNDIPAAQVDLNPMLVQNPGYDN